MSKRLTTKEFIEKAKIVHGSKYDYSQAVYVGSKSKVKIICTIHGVFEQLHHSHLSGSGCPKCVGLNKTTEEFINQAKIIHFNKYDYSLVKYFNSRTIIKIICSMHGIFEQMSTIHLIGHNCPRCMNWDVTTEEFIRKSELVHGNKYDYSLVNYNTNILNVDIICSIHGIFKQKPNFHLKG